MSLKAVIFDYGMVLSGPQEPEAYATLLRLSDLSAEQFERYYWADRHAYDEGKLTGFTFWQKLVKDANLNVSEETVHALNQWDANMWTTVNERMVAWQKALKEAGFKTAILSNMGDTVLEKIEKLFAWIHHFDVLVWSYQISIAKPDPAIYQHVLRELSLAPEETLFLDDKIENIQAARALGMQGIQFSTVEQLIVDLKTSGLDKVLPLP